VNDLKFEFDSEGKGKRIKDENSTDLSTVKAEVIKGNQRTVRDVYNEIDDDLDGFEEVLPEDNLEITEESPITEKPEVKRLIVEDVQPAKDLSGIVPFLASKATVKDLARNPYVARILFYLEEHGTASYDEIWEALHITPTCVYHCFNRLRKIGFPIYRVSQAELWNKVVVYYELKRAEQLTKDLKEARLWFEYFALKRFTKVMPEDKWIELEEMKHDSNFENLIRKHGYNFDRAIQLLAKYRVIYAKGQGEHFVKIKRAFDNRGIRTEEIEARDLLLGK